MQLGQMPRAGGVRGLEALIGLDQGLALRGVDMKIIRHVEQDAGSGGDPADSFGSKSDCGRKFFADDAEYVFLMNGLWPYHVLIIVVIGCSPGPDADMPQPEANSDVKSSRGNGNGACY